MNKDRPNILMIADEPGWVFDRHCAQITKMLSDKYDFTTCYKNSKLLTEQSLTRIFDGCYVLDSRLPFPRFWRERTAVGIRCEFSYGGTEQGARAHYTGTIVPHAALCHTVNMRQYSQFTKCQLPACKVVHAPHGYDSSMFFQSEPRRWKCVIIGSAGKPGSGGNKGFDIISTVCMKLGIMPNIANNIMREGMPDFYRGIDVYCCMSETEGLNNGIMEAAACGCCVITTGAGAVPESISNGVDGIVIGRNTVELENALLDRISDPIGTREMGARLMKKATAEWTWDHRIAEYDKMFRTIVENKV